MEKLYLSMILFHLLASSSCLTHDKGLTSAFRKAAADDDIIFTFRSISAPRRHTARAHQDLLAVELPGEDRFTILLDRAEGKVILESTFGGTKDQLAVNAEEVKGKADVESVLVELSQKGKNANVYVNCQLKGVVHLTNAPRDAIKDISVARVSYDKHAKVSIDSNVDLLNMMDKLGCHSAIDDNDIQAQSVSEIHTYRRGDIPMLSGEDKTSILVQTMSELIETIKELHLEVQTQREETVYLRDAIINCEACKPGRH